MIVGTWVSSNRRAWVALGQVHSIRGTAAPHIGAIDLDLTLLCPRTTPVTTNSSGAQSLLITRIGVREYGKQGGSR